MCIDTIAQGNTVVQKIAKINTQKGQKHYSLAVLLPFHDDDCELYPAVLRVIALEVITGNGILILRKG